MLLNTDPMMVNMYLPSSPSLSRTEYSSVANSAPYTKTQSTYITALVFAEIKK